MGYTSRTDRRSKDSEDRWRQLDINSRNEEAKKSEDKKLQKYKYIFNFFDQSMETFRAGIKKKREVEEVQCISLTEGPRNMFDTTIDALEMVSLNRDGLSRD